MTDAKIDLSLSSREFHILELALKRRSADMLDELVHTSNPEAHEDLKGMYEDLDALCRRVLAMHPAG
jgi:hypothetical protein